LRPENDNAVGTLADRIAIFILAAELVVALLTFRHYGLGWDDYTHSEYGELLLKLYGSGFADQRAFSFVNLFYYGGGFDMAAALAAKVLPFGLFETRRLINVLVGIIGLAATWRLGRRVGGPVTGVIALALIATCPVFDGDMYINAKDMPFATAMTILLWAVVRTFEEYPAPSRRTVAFLGLGLGLAFGSRVLAVTLGVGAALGLLTIAIDDFRAHLDGLQRLLRFIARCLPALLIGYLIMGFLWPWSVLSPLNPLYASDYFSQFFEKPWRELFQGRLIFVPSMPAIYLPQMFAIKLPELMLLLGFTGAGLTLMAGLRGRLPINRGGTLFTVMAAAFMPAMIAMVARPALYNGIRHFLFLVPPFAVLGGLAGAAAFEWARVRGRGYVAGALAVLLIGMALPVSHMIRLHPFQYTYFNTAAGGVNGAHDDYMVDYWGLAFKQASEALREKLAVTGQRKPAGRRWIVEICGPQRGAEVALGKDFEITWNRASADFAMMLGTFYCRDDIRAPVLVEIYREGVLYARVYDIRGMRAPRLTTEPPP
jgi:hypothetical protein